MTYLLCILNNNLPLLHKKAESFYILCSNHLLDMLVKFWKTPKCHLLKMFYTVSQVILHAFYIRELENLRILRESNCTLSF